MISLSRILCLIWFLIFPGVALAGFGSFLSKFQPSLTLQEEYTDNVDLRPDNQREDWITTLYPGIRFSTTLPPEKAPGQVPQTPATRDPWGIDLNYRLGLVYYGRETYDDYISHEGRLDTWYTFGPSLTLRLRDYFIKSEEPRELQYDPASPGYILGTQRERATYTRNVLEPSISYQFGRENFFNLNYRNNIYQTKSLQYEDSQEHYINPRLDYWFNIRNGITFEYALTLGDFERSPDLVGHLGRGRYTYRFNPRTSFFVDYVYIHRDFESPGIDYDVQNPSAGISHAFSPTLSGVFQAGYFLQNPEKGSSTDGFTLNATLT